MSVGRVKTIKTVRQTRQRKKKNRLHVGFQQEIREMGYEVPGIQIAKTVAVLYGSVLAAGFVYQLHLGELLVLVVTASMCVPYHLYHTYQNQHDRQTWKTRLDYMEQMLSSFKRHPKMLEALQDTQTLFAKEEGDARMAEALKRAVAVIQSGESNGETSVYRNAAKEIEQEYGCHRLATMHDYMEKVEQRGGEYKRAADLLLEEHALWKTNMETLRKEQKSKRIGVFLIAGVCLAISAFPAYLNNIMEGFTENLLYQGCSTLFLITVLLLLVIAENKLKGWWNFDAASGDENRVLQNYHAYQTYDMKKQKKKALLAALVFYVVAAVGLVFSNYILTAAGIAYGWYIQHFPVSRYRALRRGTIKALEYQYPRWMMEMTLLLQTENVYVSLQQSAQRAPLILKKEIKKLTKRLENEPDSVEPYNDFFADLKMDNIATSMRNLYSINSLGVEEEDALMRLIAHNNVLMNQAEQMKGREKIGIWTAFMYLPMLAGGAKIIMDTILLCAAMITSAVQTV